MTKIIIVLYCIDKINFLNKKRSFSLALVESVRCSAITTGFYERTLLTK